MVKLAMSFVVGVLIFGGLEFWFRDSPWEMRRFIFQHLNDLPRDMARWLMHSTRNIDQLSHFLFFGAAIISASLTYVISLTTSPHQTLPKDE
ncbi:hypothetical protein I7V28_01370 [Lelliottia amnigena]|uniref:hypothetical protein n=1 Tax=Lelliottia amnigena TaxID=61646 RepID=UPI00192B7979|nr:hypothetical protein [Lelliottia amnigena]MBL5919784.1 hypothetical protein [Lelliottia amnigena]